jgi:gliding motility-associated-like protein
MPMIHSTTEQLRFFVNNKVLIFTILLSSIVSNAWGSTPPSCPTIQMSGTSLDCYGDENGSAIVNIITQSSGDYTYTWSNGIIASGSSSTISNLAVGTYTVTVKDNQSGCTVIGAYVVNSPAPVNISENITHINCFGQTTGEIDVDVFGGSGPYQYAWNNGAVSQDLSNVSAGNYSLTVYAPNINCTATKSFTIDEPLEGLDHNGVGSNVDCFGESSGTINLTVWGGTPPYSFNWNSGASTEDLVNISSGNYNVVISDSKNCANTSSYEITQPDIVIGTMSATDVGCYGDGSGSVSIDLVGGSLPYHYSWFNSTTLFAQNESTMTNMSAEEYHVVVTDQNGCIYSDSIEISEPPELSANAVTLSDIDCFGGSNGELNMTPEGGSPPYSFSWANSQMASYGDSEDLNNVPASVYTVSITDLNLCTYSLSHEIFQPSTAIFVESQITDVKCFGENTGEVELNIQGGTSPFQISWSNGQSTSQIGNLSSDVYTYTVIDANLCPFSNAVTVDQPSEVLDVNYTVVDVLCNGDHSGSISLAPFGGTPPYLYSWANTTFQLSVVSSSINNFPSQDYIFQVTDSQGCLISDTISIQEPPVLTANFSVTHILCKDDSTGQITTNIGGGNDPYSFAWTNGSVSSDLEFLTAGLYEILITDDNNCTRIDQVVVEEPELELVSSYQIENVTCYNGENGSIDVNIQGGTSPYNYSWSSQDTTANVEGLSGGLYTLVITDENACLLIDTITVIQPDPIVLNEVIQPPSCYGFSDGNIDIQPEGGTAPYQFTWFDSDFALASQNEDLDSVYTDVYQLELYDSNLCFYEVFIEVNEPDSLNLDYTLNETPCPGEATGELELQASGGTPEYFYTWSNGTDTEIAENLTSGIYHVDVFDSNGCSDSLNIEIPYVDPIEITFDKTNLSCIDQSDGSATALVSGGYGGYNYMWFDNSTLSYHENLDNTWYTLLVTDVLDCQAMDSVYIESNPISCINPVNTFTPNGDDYNDTWVIDNLELYPNTEILIYNKWGNLVYKQSNSYIPWNGNENNNPLPSDSYYYIINLNEPERENLKGVITIIR